MVVKNTKKKGNTGGFNRRMPVRSRKGKPQNIIFAAKEESDTASVIEKISDTKKVLDTKTDKLISSRSGNQDTATKNISQNMSQVTLNKPSQNTLDKNMSNLNNITQNIFNQNLSSQNLSSQNLPNQDMGMSNLPKLDIEKSTGTQKIQLQKSSSQQSSSQQSSSQQPPSQQTQSHTQIHPHAHSIVDDMKFHKYASEEALKKLFHREKKITQKYTIKQRFFLKDILKKAGYENVDSQKLRDNITHVNALIIAVTSLAVLFYALFNSVFFKGLLFVFILWLLILPVMLFITWIGVYLFLDYTRYRRKTEIEDVWPEYLQLVVANINAGMLIDVALWSAVKPRYKVLAKEIEEVAKQTVTGVDIAIALREFSEKYDSPMLKRTINLLIEGMGSGGKIATLLNKIALDMQDTKIMKKEMSASVMTYAIFISFATIVAAPFLFGLATQLLIVMQKIIGSVSQTSNTTALLSFRTDSIKVEDFKIFAYVMLTITSLMSACIIGTIRKGSIRDGLRYIPLFIISTLIIYYIASSLLATLMSSFI